MTSAQHVWELSRAFLADRDGKIAVYKVLLERVWGA